MSEVFDLLHALMEGQSKVAEALSSMKAEMKENQSKVAEELSSIKAEIKENQSKVAEELSSMKAEIKENQSKVAEELSSIKADQSKVAEELSSIKRGQDLFRGEANERFLRAAIEAKYGLLFSKTFNVQGLTGLAHLVSPKKRDVCGYSARSDKVLPDTDPSEPQLVEKCVKRLISFIYESASRVLIEKNLLQYHGLTKEDVFDKTLCTEGTTRVGNAKESKDRFSRLLGLFASANPEGKKDILRQDNGLGLLLFTAALGGPIHELELDCRGRIVQLYENSFLVQVGEIKSSWLGLSDAVEKGTLVHRVLEQALRVQQENLIVFKQYLVALPKSERDSSKSPPV